MKVKAAVLRQPGQPAPYAQSLPLAIETVELAPPGPGELCVRVLAAGLCHSDLSVIDGSRPRPMPMVLGHEAAGEIVELGADDTRLSSRRSRGLLFHSELRPLRTLCQRPRTALRTGSGGQCRRHVARRRKTLA